MKLFECKPKLVSCLKNYSKETFMADLMAGIIVGIVALPLAIAFGIASGVSQLCIRDSSYTDLSTDQWLDLVFDFSDISQRTDLDIITVQFGDEGHFETGIFYFDDFKFYK